MAGLFSHSFANKVHGHAFVLYVDTFNIGSRRRKGAKSIPRYAHENGGSMLVRQEYEEEGVIAQRRRSPRRLALCSRIAYVSERRVWKLKTK